MLRPILPFLAAAGLTLGVARAASAQSDDFDDGLVGPQWSLVVDDPANLNIAETGGKAVVTATTGGSPNNDALYLSNGPGGFRLSTASDFAMQIDYRFPAPAASAGNGSAVGLVFGVGRDLDGTDSAAVGYGYATAFGLTAGSAAFAFRSDDAQSPTQTNFAAPNNGTLTLNYDADADVLSASVGGGVPFTLADTVRGVWGADALYVSFGARGRGIATPAGGASFDNFLVTSGVVVPVPEPAAAGPLALALLAARRRRRTAA